MLMLRHQLRELTLQIYLFADIYLLAKLVCVVLQTEV
jgi:hypothetical protein